MLGIAVFSAQLKFNFGLENQFTHMHKPQYQIKAICVCFSVCFTHPPNQISGSDAEKSGAKWISASRLAEALIR